MREYKKDDIAVVWDPELCIHCGICARGLPEVFKPKERPWIHTESASKDEIIRQVRDCPTGALSVHS